MIWQCDFTSTGWLVTWSGYLRAGEGISFLTGMTASAMTEAFSATTPSGSDTIPLPDTTGIHPNAVGRMDVYDVTVDPPVLLETGSTLPLVPGLSRRDILLLEKMARDHRTIAMLHGIQGRIYRQQAVGLKCPQCTDPVTGARLRHACLLCGGSGRQEGWAGPFAVAVLFQQHHAETTVPAGAGSQVESVTDVVRLDAFPRPRENDRLYIHEAGCVYIIGAPQSTVKGVTSIPAVVEVPIRIPAPGTPEATIPPEWAI